MLLSLPNKNIENMKTYKETVLSSFDYDFDRALATSIDMEEFRERMHKHIQAW
jgi:hypothetical protein